MTLQDLLLAPLGPSVSPLWGVSLAQLAVLTKALNKHFDHLYFSLCNLCLEGDFLTST